MKAHIDINVETDEDADIDDINKKKDMETNHLCDKSILKKSFFLNF